MKAIASESIRVDSHAIVFESLDKNFRKERDIYMPWKTIDFLGITNLDRSLVEQLTRFLDEKESALAYGLVKTVRSALEGWGAQISLPSPERGFSLSHAIEAVEKRSREASMRGDFPLNPDQWKEQVILPANALFWDYVEILESSVIELFQQLSQIPLERWNESLFHAVGEIKVLLLHHIEDTSWAVKRLDKLFWEYQWSWEAQHGGYLVFLKRVLNCWNTLFDPELSDNLDKSRKFLAFNFKNFSNRYREYFKLKLEAEQSAKKFEHYAIFQTLDSDTREQLKQAYVLLKIWHLNKTTKGLSQDLVNRTLANAIFFPTAHDHLKNYLKKLEDAVIVQSRELKDHPPEVLLTDEEIAVHQETIDGYKAEVHTLWTLISRYRDYLLSTDPDPYVRSRWGFSEWTVAPEPPKAKQLLEFEYATERINRLLVKILDAIKGGVENSVKVGQIKGDVYRWLHEMSQPLISKSMMKVNAERVVDTLQDFNELGSFESASVPFVGDVLSKALRADWKYHVLFDISAFEELYHIHTEIVGEIHDRQHLSRMNLFRKLTQQLNNWISARTLNKHSYEIEQDMNDIKEALQEFYTWVQKTIGKEDVAKKQIQDISHMLLEYRYLFGKFFHELKENEPDEQSMRHKFLFVDQYFESIDSKIQEVSAR